MNHLPVNWREGQFLLPQHFQAADRYWADFISTSQQWTHPYHYGISRFRHSFEGSKLRIDELQARMRDGTLVQIRERDPPLEIDLDEVLVDKPRRVYLVVPQLKLGEANIRVDAHHEGSDQADDRRCVRYVSKKQYPPDENEAGGDEPEIEFRALEVSLKCDTEERSGFDELPIAQIRRAMGNEGGPQLDEKYFPPAVDIDAWESLGLGIVRGIHDQLVDKIDQQASALSDVDIHEMHSDVARAGRFAFLDRLNEAAAVLGTLIRPARGVHPFTAYTELCRLAGKLSIYGPGKRLEKIDAYDHDDLGRVFWGIHNRITRLLSKEFEGCLQEDFAWDGDIMLAELTADWFNEGTDWFIGVRRGVVTPDDCRRLLSRANNFLWKFGSPERDIRRLAATGLDIKPEDNSSPLLPPPQYWSYWKVPTDLSDPNFKAVHDNRKLALFINYFEQPWFRPSSFVGTNRFPVLDIRSDNKTVEFQIALFGVSRS